MVRSRTKATEFTLRLFMMTTNLFVIANVKHLRTDGSFRILLYFFRISWSVGVLNSIICNSFHNRVEFGTILEDLRNFWKGGSFNTPNNSPPRYATVHKFCEPELCVFFSLQDCCLPPVVMHLQNNKLIMLMQCVITGLHSCISL